MRAEELHSKGAWLAGRAIEVDGGWIAVQKITGVEPGELRHLAGDAVSQLHAGPAIVIVGMEHAGKALLAAAISRGLLDGGVQAAQVITRAAKAVGGGGGGTGAIASAGGRHPENLDQALTVAAEDATRLLGGR
ncbi:DHHA1 domain-containing protein [Streptomyces sp. NPDC054933]